MRDNYYQCDGCNKTFTRRSNAKRHIRVVHGGKGLAFNSVTGKSSVDQNDGTKTDTGSLAPQMEIGLNYHRPSILEKQEEDKRMLRETLIDIRRPFEELEKLVFHLNEVQRSKYLTDQVIAALLTSNPAKHLQDSVDMVNLTIMQKSLFGYISKTINNENLKPENTLMETFKIGKYYRNKKNLSKYQIT